jgi:hypothetical protein
MNRFSILYGLIVGTLLSANMLIMVNFFSSNSDMGGSELVGYASMVIIFALIFFGIRNYRNRQMKGVMSFGQAFKAGAIIAAIAATMYVITWMICLHFFIPDFMDKYVQHVLTNTPQAELAEQTKKMNSMAEMYKNPLLRILFTYMEVLPAGLIVALISAFILKRKPKVVA